MDTMIRRIRSDLRGEFKNSGLVEFCDKASVTREFFSPYTTQSNSVVERKSRAIQEMAGVMLYEMNVPKNFWEEVVSAATYIVNISYVYETYN